MDILLLEAYYGGSHKLWADQLKKYSSHNITILSLPDRHWKWRMEGAAIAFANMLKDSNQKPDLLIATSMLDLSFLKSNLPKGWKDVPCIYYMHENQLSYPKSAHDQDAKKGRDFHYGMIQFKSMLTADKTCFNSAYHKNIFFEKLGELLHRLPDYSPKEQMKTLQEEATVLALGIEDTRGPKVDNSRPIILWNHRWEYDKNPALFFNSLIELQEQADFGLIVLGSKARSYPEVFDSAKEQLSSRIEHWGYVGDYQEYLNLLNRADLLPVTSNQDFFGISIMESVLAGAVPILPNRLVYPEHFDLSSHANLFYNTDEEFKDLLAERIKSPIEESQKNSLINKAKEYLWSAQITNYDQFFESSVI